MFKDTLKKQDYIVLRNRYFDAIKKAKKDYQNAFLEKGDLKSIFKAFIYIKNRQIQQIPPIWTSLEN